MELITIIVGTTIIIGGLWFMRTVILYLEKEVSKQKDIIQEQADEIEYLNFIIALKKYGKVVSCKSWIVERFLNEKKDSIPPDDIVSYNKYSKTLKILTDMN
jgi:hypothetical protein